MTVGRLINITITIQFPMANIDHSHLNNVSQSTKDIDAANGPSERSALTHYTYPSDLGGGQKGSFILFTIHVPKSILSSEIGGNNVYGLNQLGASGDTRTLLDSRNTTTSSSLADTFNAAGGDEVAGDNSASIRSALSNFKFAEYQKIDKAIALYMPGSLNFSSSITWNERDMGIVGDVLNADTSGLLRRSLRNIGSATESLLNLPAESLVEAQSGSILNPYREILFKGLANRTFQFSFKFMPRSQKEAATVADIVRLFRYHSHPSLTGTNAALYTYPSQYDIEFYHHNNNNSNIPKISTCACTSVNVSYNDNGVFATHPDGQPVETTLSLQFTELEVLTKERIKEGF